MYLSLQPSAAALPSTAVVPAVVGQPFAAVGSSASAATVGSSASAFAATVGSSSVTRSLLFYLEPAEYTLQTSLKRILLIFSLQFLVLSLKTL